MNNTIENKKIIVEFMELPLRRDTKDYPEKFEKDPYYDDLYVINNGQPNWYSIRLGNMPYDSSWDWLMPVVEKIENLEETISIDIIAHAVIIYAKSGRNSFKPRSFSDSENRFDNLYNACVAFILWYNKQKKLSL